MNFLKRMLFLDDVDIETVKTVLRGIRIGVGIVGAGWGILGTIVFAIMSNSIINSFTVIGWVCLSLFLIIRAIEVKLESRS